MDLSRRSGPKRRTRCAKPAAASLSSLTAARYRTTPTSSGWSPDERSPTRSPFHSSGTWAEGILGDAGRGLFALLHDSGGVPSIQPLRGIVEGDRVVHRGHRFSGSGGDQLELG